MSGYCVFQAYDAGAARELCRELPNIELLILNESFTADQLLMAVKGLLPSQN
jgi:hypothetical protein